jgi:hypothetical protein
VGEPHDTTLSQQLEARRAALHLVNDAHVLHRASLVCIIGLSGVGVGDLVVMAAPVVVAGALPAAGWVREGRQAAGKFQSAFECRHHAEQLGKIDCTCKS